MVTKEEILEILEGVREKFNHPATKSKFKGYDRTLQFYLTDLELTYHTRVHNESIDPFEEGKLDKPDLLVTTESETLLGIIKGNLSPLDAYSVGKLKVRGSMTDLLKLQILM